MVKRNVIEVLRPIESDVAQLKYRNPNAIRDVTSKD